MNIKTLALLGAALTVVGACSQKPQATSQVADQAAAPATPASPAGAAQRIRGVVQAVAPGSLTVQTYDGRTVTVPLDAGSGVAWVVGSSLSQLKDGDFIGTATTGPDDALRAVELVIFPASMRGTGEGHYGWDVPGVIAAGQGGAAGAGASSAMTNGTVQQQSGMTNGTVQQQSAMTNGTVQQQSGMTNGTVRQQSAMTNGTVAAGAGKAGATQLTITYKGGASRVLVPAGAPIVRFEPAQASVLQKGQKVFAVIPPGATAAKFVAVGKNGVTPPM